MKYLSVCSGIEAATVAWHHLGWTPAAFAEVEPFPSAVLKHHYKETPNLGDMNNYDQWRIDPIDLLVGGTPCQSFSLAGLRKGTGDKRGQLANKFCELVQHKKPKWVIWENVPGVLSSNSGRDFGAFLGALANMGYGVAYRVLDAQGFGLAHRRKRVFLVGCYSDMPSAIKVLFEQAGVPGVHTPERSRNQKAATAFARSDDYHSGVMCLEHEGDWDDCGCSCEEDFECPFCGEWSSGLYETPKSTGCNSCGAWAKSPVNCISDGAHMGGGLNGQDYNSGRIIVQPDGKVRRLTPLELERLMGFPDDYTNIPNAKDGPRYKALGNSMAVPVMKWIGERIDKVEKGTL